MTTEPYEESVQEAVARETARRKRVLLAFLGLLLLPIGIGAWALAKAPTEIEKVAVDVTPMVTERVSHDISTRVTADVVARTEPLVRQNVSAAASSLRNDITSLQTSVQQTSDLVTRVTPQLAAVPELNTRLSTLETNQSQFREQMVQQIEKASTQLTNGTAASRQEIAELRRSLADELATIRTTADANRGAITTIERRLAVMEVELKKLNARVANVERQNPDRTPR